ncbi:phage tail protein [Betaproteobacteria bacterium GR16-43]|nr:phage tail protein [Betaproteobacteria bacterium GR16-43]
MSEPFIGQISVVGFNFAPKGWALCNGQLLSIAQNQALFSILGTTYGGNGVQNFALPDLRSRAAMHWNGNYPLGAMVGTENETLQVTQIPLHTHTVNAVKEAGTLPSPAANIWAGSTGNDLQYGVTAPDVFMAPTAIGPGGGGQPHNNMPPVNVLNFIIALVGIFPSRN